MEIYVLRHGTTNWNEKGIIQGRRHNRLSKNGVQLVENRAEENKDLPVDIIYASPLFRTMQTTKIFNKYHNAKVIKDDRLLEINQGILSGRKRSTLNEEEKQQRQLRSKSYGMESYKEVYERAKLFIEDIIKKEKHEHILIVSHNCVCSYIDCVLTKRKPEFDDPKKACIFGNAELKKYSIN